MDRAPKDRTPGAPSPRVPTRVLLVLDQPVVAELIKLTLDHGAFEARQAVSAAEALVALGRWRPHLVLLDMDLEGVGGARVMERIASGVAGGTRSRRSRSPAGATCGPSWTPSSGASTTS